MPLLIRLAVFSKVDIITASALGAKACVTVSIILGWTYPCILREERCMRRKVREKLKFIFPNPFIL